MLIAFLAANLSRKLNCHTLRFDFTGNGHSNGTWKYGGYDIEARDLNEVIRFVHEQMKCRVSCVIGHSKGAYSVFRRAWEQESMPVADRIPCFVNLSGSFYVPHKYSAQERFTKEQLEELKSTGKILMEMRGARKYEARNEDIEEKTLLDSSRVQLIQTSHVLTIHGGADDIVEMSNAYKFSDAIKPHELKIIDGGDHAFNGLRHMDELTDTIATFIRKRT
jgi:alpha/beta superfamily hydrolase